MSSRQSFLLISFLALCHPAFAQHPQNRGGHPGGTGIHPAQRQPHAMTPEMHQNAMMQQWWQEQMMLNEMMSMPRTRRHHTQPQTGTRQSQAGLNQSQTGASERQAGMNEGSMSRRRGLKQQAQSQSSASEHNQPNPEKGKRGALDSGASAKTNHTESRSTQKTHPREAIDARRRPLAADQRMISLLRTTHTKLQGADHDYDGHRVRAMRHIENALHHLGGMSALNTNVLEGSGNLPQAQSDQILRDSIVHLNMTEKSLGTVRNAAEHHRSARTSVAEAIHELHTALKIR